MPAFSFHVIEGNSLRFFVISTNVTMLNGCNKFIPFSYPLSNGPGGAVASWLVRSSPDRAVRVRALAGDIVLRSWARHFTLTVPLSTNVCKRVPENLILGVTLRWTNIPSRGEGGRNTPSRFRLLKPVIIASLDGPLGSYADLTYLVTLFIFS